MGNQDFCPTCNRPNLSPYREASVDVAVQQKQSILKACISGFTRAIVSAKSFPLVKIFTSIGFGIVFGVFALALVVGSLWVLFPGIAYFGSIVNSAIVHWNDGSTGRAAQPILDWCVGFLTVVVAFFSHTLGKYLRRKTLPALSRKVSKVLSSR